MQQLVEGKRKWCSNLTREDQKLGFCGWHERGYIPHCDEPGLVQFVTYRLTDCFPRTLMSEWEDILRILDNIERREQLQDYLDRGRGECHLRDARIASLIEGSLLRFHGEQYDLRAWAIMENHVHVLFQVFDIPMSTIVGRWKSYTAHEANKILHRKGTFWDEDYWDTYVRDLDHEISVRNYIENNPVKAHCVLMPKEWPWSSARFRDDSCRLKLDMGRAAPKY